LLFFSYEYQGIQTKNPFDEILSLNFDLGFYKMNNNASDKNQFCKGLSKGLIYKNTFDEKKIKRVKLINHIKKTFIPQNM
jgi:hypothetical protein